MPEATTADRDEAPAAKSTIGIIYPPPEIRNIVDKTASFVARIGPDFETRIRQNEVNNPKFNFLDANDPYNAYYQHKVGEFREGTAAEPTAARPSGVGLAPERQQDTLVQKLPAVEQIVLKDPPPEPEFIAEAPSISAYDLEVVKLTAQFVARNGRQFLTSLIGREQKNYQFDFLRPQHSLFNYFTKLVEQYIKVMIPPKNLLLSLARDSSDRESVLQQVKYRVEWAKFQQREKERQDEIRERERVAFLQIDWHDFVVVETVDYQVGERGNFPPPTTPEEVGTRALLQERKDRGEKIDLRKDKNEEDEVEPRATDEIDTGGASSGEEEDGMALVEESDEEDDNMEMPTPVSTPALSRAPSAPLRPPLPHGAQPPLPKDAIPPLPPAPENVVVKSYDPKEAAAVAASVSEKGGAPDEWLISPITGERIPAKKLQEHVRINLLDPNWKDQRARMVQEKREQEEVFAPGASVSDQLKHLAQHRTDMFGIASGETEIGKKIDEKDEFARMDSRVTWDGSVDTVEKVSREARRNVSVRDQIKMIQQNKGLVPPMEGKESTPPIPEPPKTTAAPPPKVPPPPTSSAVPVPLHKAPAGMSTKSGESVQPPLPPAAPPVSSEGNAPVPVVPPQQPSVPVVLGQVPAGMQIRPQMIPQPNPGMLVQPVVRVAAPQVVAVPSFIVQQPAPMRVAPPATSSDEPPAKKGKTEDQLLPEEQFLAQHQSGGPVVLRVQVPSMPDKPEFQLNGQTLTVSLPLTDTVSVVKAKLHEMLGMPVGKQKLQHEGMFIKDSNTLAFYNMKQGAIIQLALKERGGRKK